MQSNRPHEIDRLAKGIFLEALPVELVANDIQNPDYGKDYLLEICEAGSMSGEQCLVQLKGTQKPMISRNGGHISFRLDRKDAAYYADKLKLPVFLVLVDVTKRSAYWLFTQQYLREHTGWRHKKQAVVRIPTVNTLRNGARLLQAIRSAREYMTGLQPAAIKTAILAKKQSLENLDPRFNVSVQASEKGEHYVLNAKEVVSLTFAFAGNPENAKKAIHDLIGRGLPVQFGPGEMTVVGSPLFEELIKAGGTLHCCRETEGALVLIALDASERELARLTEVRAVVRGGPNEIRIEAELLEAPFIMKSMWTPEAGKTSASVKFAAKRWFGQPILHLAYFDQLTPSVGAMKDAASVRFELSHRGNLALPGTFYPTDRKMFEEFSEFLSLLVHARAIAKWYSINPAVPQGITESHVSGVANLYTYVRDGELRRRLGKQHLRIEMREPNWGALEETFSKEQTTYPLEFGTNELKGDLLDHEFAMGELELQFTHIVVGEDEIKKLKQQVAIRTVPVRLECSTTKECEIIIRRGTPRQQGTRGTIPGQPP